MEKGLTEEQVRQKQLEFGKNEITSQKTFSAIALFFSQFKNILIIILFIAAIVSFIIGDAIDGFFILAVIILNACFGFVQEYKAEKSIEKLKEYVKSTTRVIRDGKETQIPTSSLVPGDMVTLTEGA